MIPAGRRLGEVVQIIDEKKYFAIHAPWQTGKTTLLRNLSRELTAGGNYAALTVSLESFVQSELESSMPRIIRHLRDRAAEQLSDALLPPPIMTEQLDPETALRNYLASWSKACPNPVVLFIDKIDSLHEQILLSVLRQLRDGYTSRPAPFPQSVALVGLRDVRDYRVRLRENRESLGTSSPFNIKYRSFSLRNFNEAEVEELLGQHTKETGQKFDEETIAEIWRQTKGQPWLVNALAGQLTTEHDALVPDPSETVTKEHLQDGVRVVICRA
jgi:type II secretory pathway predicted ATPase ExeA